MLKGFDLEFMAAKGIETFTMKDQSRVNVEITNLFHEFVRNADRFASSLLRTPNPKSSL